MRFGLLQSKLGLATLLSKYRFSPCEDTSIPLKMDPRAIFASPEDGQLMYHNEGSSDLLQDSSFTSSTCVFWTFRRILGTTCK
uniref:(California timema) hypothetical protein n=1 Tax=Timema californicum TaxID=61474 RepID=A0A7R9JLM0_TIMCA|nr:unnamed protein product [Timema californicum]